MNPYRTVLAGISACLACAGIAMAQGGASRPVFSPAANVGWISYGPDFIPEPSGPQPITFDPAHPFIENGIEYNAARPGTKDESIQSTFPVADLTNPILQPWAREELRKLNERVLAGRPLYSRQSSCWPMGVPGFLLYVVNPVYFLQTEKQVVGGQDLRRRSRVFQVLEQRVGEHVPSPHADSPRRRLADRRQNGSKALPLDLRHPLGGRRLDKERIDTDVHGADETRSELERLRAPCDQRGRALHRDDDGAKVEERPETGEVARRGRLGFAGVPDEHVDGGTLKLRLQPPDPSLVFSGRQRWESHVNHLVLSPRYSMRSTTVPSLYS